MKRFTRARRTAIALPLATIVAAIGFLAAGAFAQSSTGAAATVSLRTTKLGAILVAPNGRTLYLFAKDRGGKSSCNGGCAAYWPPLLAHGKPTAGTGVKASLLGTTKRSNGSMQVTYAKHPLYTFALDKSAGQTTGEGSSNFGAKWWAVSASGAAVVKAAAAGTPPTTTTTGGGYSSPYP
jgi:predicted lipoprotein with Yx(FWY)xxD motif